MTTAVVAGADRHVLVRQGYAGLGMAGAVRIGGAARGKSGLGRRGSFGSLGSARQGLAGVEGQVQVGHVQAGRVVAVTAGLGPSRSVVVRLGGAVKARQGKFWLGGSGQVMARQAWTALPSKGFGPGVGAPEPIAGNHTSNPNKECNS